MRRRFLLLKFHIADSQDLIHDKDLAVKVRGDREREFDIHSARISLDGSVDELTALGKIDYAFYFGIDLRAGHSEDRTVQINILPTRQFGVEARPDFEHT